jgi:guanylate kinase
MKKNNKVLIISGPTGSGESTITKQLTLRYPIFQRLITATSRPIRSGETNGCDYYFFSKKEFLKKIKDGEILEYTYVENRGAYYGTYKRDLERKLKDGYVIVNVDKVGVEYYKKNYKALAIFIKPDALENIIERLKKRNPEITEKELMFRMESAKKELTDEEGYYDYSVINADGKLENAISDIVDVLKKEQFFI